MDNCVKSMCFITLLTFITVVSLISYERINLESHIWAEKESYLSPAFDEEYTMRSSQYSNSQIFTAICVFNGSVNNTVIHYSVSKQSFSS